MYDMTWVRSTNCCNICPAYCGVTQPFV
jgi:hypothetical protein